MAAPEKHSLAASVGCSNAGSPLGGASRLNMLLALRCSCVSLAQGQRDKEVLQVSCMQAWMCTNILTHVACPDNRKRCVTKTNKLSGELSLYSLMFRGTDSDEF